MSDETLNDILDDLESNIERSRQRALAEAAMAEEILATTRRVRDGIRPTPETEVKS